jgi:hypothetical protein
MLAKKTPTSPARSARKELEYLYARRTAINTLIQSLEQYDRFRALQFAESKRKSA